MKSNEFVFNEYYTFEQINSGRKTKVYLFGDKNGWKTAHLEDKELNIDLVFVTTEKREDDHWRCILIK